MKYSKFACAFLLKKKVKNLFVGKKKKASQRKKKSRFFVEVENYNNQKTIFLPEIFKLIFN